MLWCRVSDRFHFGTNREERAGLKQDKSRKLVFDGQGKAGAVGYKNRVVGGSMARGRVCTMGGR